VFRTGRKQGGRVGKVVDDPGELDIAIREKKKKKKKKKKRVGGIF